MPLISPKISLCSLLAAFLFIAACDNHQEHDHASHDHHDHDHHDHDSHDHHQAASASTEKCEHCDECDEGKAFTLPEDYKAPEVLKIAVSVPPHAWLTKKLTKDSKRFEVLTALPVGAHPATYQPADHELSQLMKHHLYFRCGVPYENAPWFKTLGESKMQLVDLRSGLELIEADHDHDHDHAHENAYDHEGAGQKEEKDHAEHKEAEHDDHKDHDHEKTKKEKAGHQGHDDHNNHDDHDGHDDHKEDCADGHLDPHIWTSPKMLAIQAEAMTTVLNMMMPEEKELLAKNLAAVKTELIAMDTRISERLKPLKEKAFLIYHPAWGYFARDFGLTQIALEIEGKTPSDKEVTEFQKMAKEKNLKFIVVQPQMQPAFAKTIANEIGGRVVIIDPLNENIEQSINQLVDTLLSTSPADAA